MSNHAWCRDIPRDEAVRAAEDNRQGPLPTLEDAIARASPLPGRVDGTHWADWERLRAERDAAICEREELRGRVETLETAIKAAALEIARLNTAPAASGAANSSAETVSAEPVAWGVVTRGIVLATSTNRSDAVDMQSEHVCDTAVVPLYAAPPPARGWLTEEERAAIRWAASEGFDEDALRNLLARSSPPEVVLPVCEFTPDSTHAMGWWEAIGKAKKALAAAGVKVKEVGRE